MNYIAHIRETDRHHQTVEEHLLGVKALAESFGSKMGVSHIAGLAGMLHDMGKYTDAFRSYILEAVNNPDTPPKRGSVDHSTAGGKLLYNLFHAGEIHPIKGLLAEIVGNAIISHHSYLQDLLNPELESNYLKRIRDKRDSSLEEFERTQQLFFQYVTNEAKTHSQDEFICRKEMTMTQLLTGLRSRMGLTFWTSLKCRG